MTLKHMRIFLAVYKENNITQAATKLHLTQPAVSRAIKEIEEYYQTKLFERLSHHLYVTKQGEQFYQYTSQIIHLVDEMETNLTQSKNTYSLRIGTSITIGNLLLPKLVSNLKKQFPTNEITSRIMNSSAVQKAIVHNELDIGLIEGPLLFPELVATPFMEDELVLIAPTNHDLLKQDIYLKELENYPMLLREKGSASRDIFDSAMRLINTEVAPIWESNSNQALIEAVHNGLGISILPKLLVNDAIKNGYVATTTIIDSSFKRELSLVYHRNKYLNPLALEFIDSLLE